MTDIEKKQTNFQSGSGISEISSTGSVADIYRVSDDKEFYVESIVVSDTSGAANWIDLYDYDSTDGDGDNTNKAVPRIHLASNEVLTLDKDEIGGLVMKEGIGGMVKADGVDVLVTGKEIGGGANR